MRKARFSSLLTRIGLLAIVTLSGAPARADFLDDLFGGGDSAPQAAAPARARPTRAKPARNVSRDTYSIRLLDARKPRRQKDRADAEQETAKGDAGHGPYVAGSRPQKAALCVSADAARPDNSTAYLRDETLRAGDSVVTEGSIIVFKGNRACPHRATDFVSVARADLPRGKRNALAALELGMRAPQRAFTVEASADRARVAGRDTR